MSESGAERNSRFTLSEKARTAPFTAPTFDHAITSAHPDALMACELVCDLLPRGVWGVFH